jgi:hypothetical protein
MSTWLVAKNAYSVYQSHEGFLFVLFFNAVLKDYRRDSEVGQWWHLHFCSIFNDRPNGIFLRQLSYFANQIDDDSLFFALLKIFNHFLNNNYIL